MSAARLATGIWVAAYLARLGQRTIPAYVIHRGDDTAGAIALSVVRPSGRVELWSQEYDFDSDQRPWVMQAEGAPPEIDATVTRRRAADPDLWVIELELPDAQPLAELID